MGKSDFQLLNSCSSRFLKHLTNPTNSRLLIQLFLAGGVGFLMSLFCAVLQSMDDAGDWPSLGQVNRATPTKETSSNAGAAQTPPPYIKQNQTKNDPAPTPTATADQVSSSEDAVSSINGDALSNSNDEEVDQTSAEGSKVASKNMANSNENNHSNNVSASSGESGNKKKQKGKPRFSTRLPPFLGP